MDAIVKRLIQGKQRGKKHSIIVVAEGVSSAEQVAKVINEKSGYETRVIVLGHIQRGGSPTAADRLLGSQLGARAVDQLLAGKSGVMVGVKNNCLVDVPFEIATSENHELSLSLYELAQSLAI